MKISDGNNGRNATVARTGFALGRNAIAASRIEVDTIQNEPPNGCQATRFTQRRPRTAGRRIAIGLPATLTSAALVRLARPREPTTRNGIRTPRTPLKPAWQPTRKVQV